MEKAISSSPSTSHGRLHAWIAVVTGGNKGIGLEVCRQLAGNGVTVVLTARDEMRGEAAVDKLRELGLSNVIFHQLDITDASSIARLADFLKTRFGRLDILINNAAFGGVEYVRDPASGSVTSDEEVSLTSSANRAAKKGLQTNYYGTKHVIEALLPLVQASPDGRIVNVSSDFGLLRFFRNEELKQELNDVGNLSEERLDELLDMFLKDFEAGKVDERGWPAAFAAYKVAKAAMNAYSRILAAKQPAVRVNCVHPGYIKTDMTIHSGLLTPEEGGRRVVKVALLPEGVTGAFFEDGEEASFV
ncbi:hypothetical protein HU200_031503 [Digitaria exilis]|uniref:Uncharacterized protein n=1 Tax=Digitaria exilis TaxID=1010633 RepID=A0A835C0M4_9POAL|nr:hypothetical protein HU200_031503 [Digitaria exilis]